ncbi:MAG: hypothetical protein ACYDAL_10045 [Candidatus Dormibacteraceae bacterium]
MTRESFFRRPEVLATLALAAVYLAVMSGHSYSIDGVLMYRQALAIVHNFSLRFPAPIYWGDVFTTSKYGIGLSLVYVPGVALLALLGFTAPTVGSNPYDWTLFYRDLTYTIGAAPIHILVTATTAYLVAVFVRALGYSSKTSLFALASYGLASPAFVYSRGDFAQPLLGLCLVAGLLSAWHYRVGRTRAALVAAAASLLLAVLTRPVEGSFLLVALALVIVPDLKLTCWTKGVYRDLAIVAASYALAVVVTLAVNWARFGSPTQTGYSEISWGTAPWIGVPGVMLSPARGIVWQFPLMLLAPLGFWKLRRAAHARLALAIAGLALLLFLNTALWVPWWGAWSWGSRLFVPAWPLLAILAAIGAVSLRPALRVWLPAGLFSAGFLWAVPGVATDLLGGYAAANDGSSQSFALSGYPPIGAWRFLHHLRANDLGDSNALDILWFRIARRTDNASLLAPVILALSAVTLGWKALQAERASANRQATSVETTLLVQAKDS